MKSSYSIKGAGLHMFLSLKQESKTVIHIIHTTACSWQLTVDNRQRQDASTRSTKNTKTWQLNLPYCLRHLIKLQKYQAVPKP